MSLPDIQGNVRESGQGKIDLERTSLSTTGYCPMTLYSDRSHCNRSGCLESLDSQSESATQHSASPTPVSSNEPQPNWCDANLSPKEGVYPESVPMSSQGGPASFQMPVLSSGSATFTISHQELSSLISRAVQQVLQDANETGLSIGDLNGMLAKESTPDVTADTNLSPGAAVMHGECRSTSGTTDKKAFGETDLRRSIDDQAQQSMINSQPPPGPCTCTKASVQTGRPTSVKSSDMCKEQIVPEEPLLTASAQGLSPD